MDGELLQELGVMGWGDGMLIGYELRPDVVPKLRRHPID